MPLTLTIVSMIVVISMIHSVYFEDEETFSLQNFMFGIVALLAVFIVLIVTINKSQISRPVYCPPFFKFR